MPAELSEIERNIVFDYLIRGRVPVEICSRSGKCATVMSDKFSIAEKNVMVLLAPPDDVVSMAGSGVSVRFSYMGVALSFCAEMRMVEGGVSFVVPPVVTRESGRDGGADGKESPFSVLLFYESPSVSDDGTEFVNKRDVECTVRSDYGPLNSPSWADMPGEMKERASGIIRDTVRDMDGGIPPSSRPNRMFLIPAVRYALESSPPPEIPEVVFLNHERIVLGVSDSFPAGEGDEFAAWISFPMKRPLNERKVYVSFLVERIVASGCRRALVGRFSSIKLEDIRFLYEFSCGKS